MQVEVVVVLLVGVLHKTGVVLCTEVDIVFGTVVTARNLKRDVAAIVCLAQELAAIEIYIRITVGVHTSSRIIDGSSIILGAEAIVGTSLVVQCHILSSTEILWVTLGKIQTAIGADVDMQGSSLTTFCGNQDDTLGTLAAVESHRTGGLQDSNRLNHGRLHHVSIARNPVDQDKSTLSPDIPIVATDQA